VTTEAVGDEAVPAVDHVVWSSVIAQVLRQNIISISQMINLYTTTNNVPAEKTFVEPLPLVRANLHLAVVGEAIQKSREAMFLEFESATS
jgi:hypothetical protein